MATGLIGHLVLFGVLFFTKRFRSFPLFSALIVFNAIQTIALYVVAQKQSSHAYFMTYWGLAGGDYVLTVGVIFEIARNVLGPTGAWIRDARRIFFFWLVSGLFLAAFLTVTIVPPGLTGLGLWAERSSVFTSFLICEMYFAMLTAANSLGLQWRNHVMALGQGLTFWAAAALIADVAHLATGWHKEMRGFDNARDCAYLVALVFWIVRFLQPERQRGPLSPEMQQYLSALHDSVRHDLNALEPGSKPFL